jgi:hypothetical protein
MNVGIEDPAERTHTEADCRYRRLPVGYNTMCWLLASG